MARPRENDEAASESIRVRLTPGLLAHVDTMRGSMTRSAYLRMLVAEQIPVEELVDTSTTQGRGSRPSRRTPDRHSRPNHLAVVADQDRHLHRYTKGDIIRYHQGRPIYRYTCECGADKEDT